jgi:hypothetical protein
VPRTTTATRLSFSGKAPGQWYYRVRACNCRDCGDWSDVQSTVVAAQAPLLLGNTSCTWGSRDCNPCANNVVAAFNSLRYRGDILGFHLGEHPDPAYNELWQYHQHWQGIQRIAAGDGRTMVVSHDEARSFSVLGVVRMGSRNGSGERYRSNRLLWDVDIEDTVPSSGDAIATTVWIDDVHEHPGSIQSMGSYLVVGTGNEIHFYDFQNPLSPQHLGPPDPSAWDGIGHILYRTGKSGSSTAMGQLQDGRYLLVVANSDAKDLDFYVSQQPYSLQQPGTYPTFQDPYPWERSQVSMGLGEFTFYYDWDTFQNISLVTECGTGQLYLVATGNLDITANCVGQWIGKACYPNGLNYASLYQVRLLGGQIMVEKVAERWFDCEYRGKTYCNFDAAAGVYVDPQGQLILYAAEHTSTGPANTIKMMEFRPMPPGRCDTEQGAWVELYEEPGFTGRSIMIDYVDRDLEDYSNYDRVEDFEDQASSVLWCLPPGLSYVLHQDKEPCGGGLLQLFGDGSMHGITHLSQYGWDYPDGGRVSCSYFYPVTPVLAQINAITGGTLVYNTLRPSPPQGSDAEGLAATGSAAEQGGSTTVQIPPGALSQNIELTYTPRFPPAHDPQPLISSAYAFELQARAGGVPLQDLTLAAPAQITIHYDGAALSEMVYESTLRLGLYDEASGAWVDASKTCGPTSLHEHNPESDWLRVGACRIGEMALLGEPIQRFMKLPIVLKSYDRSLRVQPTPTAPPIESLRDDFDGPSLASEWWWRHENTDNWSLTARPGFLRIWSQAGAVWQENLLLRGAPNGDFAVATRVLFEPVSNFQFAGLVLYEDDENYLLLGRGYCDLGPPTCAGNAIYFGHYQGGQPVGSNYAKPTASLDEAYLRVIRVGTTYFGYYSADGQDWFTIGTHTLATGNLSAVGVGVGQDESSAHLTADFDFVEMRMQPQAGTKRVLFDEAHGEGVTLSWPRAQQLLPEHPDWIYCGRLQEDLADEFTLVRSPDAALTAQLLARYDGVILASPQQEVTPAERQALEQFMADGGGVLWLGGSGWVSEAFLQGKGIDYDGRVLFDMEGNGDFEVTDFSGHAAVSGVTRMVTNWDGSLEVGWPAVALATTPSDVFRDLNGDFQYDAGEPAGPLTIAAAYESGSSRLVFLSGSPFQDHGYDWRDNTPFMRALLRWLTGPR